MAKILSVFAFLMFFLTGCGAEAPADTDTVSASAVDVSGINNPIQSDGLTLFLSDFRVGWSGAVCVEINGDYVDCSRQMRLVESQATGELWHVYTFKPADARDGAFLVRFTRLGDSGPSDSTNWADLEDIDDDIVWITLKGTPTLCLDVVGKNTRGAGADDCRYAEQFVSF